MPEFAKAAVITEFAHDLEVRDVPIPDLEPGGVLGRVDAATLCGTDVHLWSGHAWIGAETLPYIPGHETAATVAEIGGEALDIMGQPLHVGDRIIANYPYCGHCYYCTVAEQANLCETGARYGRERADTAPYLLGGTAEYHYYPPRADFIRIPDDVPPPLAASAACALRTIMHGVERLGKIASHETVLVQGAGPIGLYALAVAKDHGAGRVFVFGAPDERLAVTKSWGAEGTLNIDTVSTVDRKAWLLEQTGGLGPDVVIQGASAAAMLEALDLVRRGGRVLSIGGGSGDLSIPAFALTTKYITIIGILQAEARHYHQALQFLETRRNTFPFDSLITGRYPLEGVSDALQAMADLKEVKPVILPHGL